MISKSITEGFKFALSLKRVIPYIIVDLIVFYLLIILFSNFISMTEFNILVLLFSFAWFIPAIIIIALVQVWINGAIIDQAKYFPRERSLRKSFKYSTSRYLSILCALIIYGIINWILSMPRYIGTILVFVFSLVMYYLYPAIIVGRKRCLDAFKNSWRVFKRYPLETFVTWLLQSIISLIIVGLFALPLIFLFLGHIVSVFRAMIPTPVGVDVESIDFIQLFIPGMLEAVRSPLFVPYLFVLIVALSFTKLFNLGVQTRLYMNTRRRAL